MREIVDRLGCPDASRKLRLSAFASLRDAWDASDSPSDLVWLAIRIANTPHDRAVVALAFAMILQKIPLSPVPKTVLEQALTNITSTEEGPSSLPALGRTLKPHVATLKGEYVKADRQARGRSSPATFATRAAATGLEAVALICAGGWPSKAAETAALAIEETSKALGAEASGLAQQLRELVPFENFTTGWFSFGTRSGD
jgi:hypothetical protein